MNRSVTELPSEILTRVQGYRQITDAALVGLARERRGRIATFDAGLANLQPAGPATLRLPDSGLKGAPERRRGDLQPESAGFGRGRRREAAR